MQRLCTGILNLTPGWQSLLDQTGIWYEEVNIQNLTANNYSVVIANKSSSEISDSLEQFVKSGGSLLDIELTRNPSSGLPSFHSRSVKTILNSGAFPFLNHIPFLDIYSKAALSGQQTSFENLIHFASYDRGHTAFLGIDPGKLFTDNSSMRKRFYFKPEMHPDELVSTVSKGSLAELLIALLKELHLRRDLPFIQKWTSPEKNPVFAFRVDSDYGDKNSVDQLSRSGEKFHIPLTWFLHVQAHEEWLSYFKTVQARGQEIALHGYEHGTSRSFEHVYHNVERGLQLLRDKEFNPKGFCVPYGIWNETLANVLTHFDFEYTSEFTVGYDTLPFYPVHQTGIMQSLQIPVHPICTGSLKRKYASHEDMSDYFIMKLYSKLSRFEPAIFYHHPLQPGLSAIEKLFGKVRQSELVTLSFADFAHFWKKRLQSNFEAFFDPSSASLTISSENKNILFQYATNHEGFDIIPVSSAVQQKRRSEFQYSEAYLPQPEDVTELKSRKLQLWKTSFLDWKNRNTL